jgi:hypothetical protein
MLTLFYDATTFLIDRKVFKIFPLFFSIDEYWIKFSTSFKKNLDLSFRFASYLQPKNIFVLVVWNPTFYCSIESRPLHYLDTLPFHNLWILNQVQHRLLQKIKVCHLSRGNFKIRSNSKWASLVFFVKCTAKLSQNFRGIESHDNRMSF